MRVDHRGADIGVAQQFLHSTDVVAGLQQVGGETVAQGVRRSGLLDAGIAQGAAKGALEITFQQMMPAHQARARIRGQFGLREHPMPGPGLGRTAVLALQRVRQVHAGHALGAVQLPLRLDVSQVGVQRGLQRGGQHHHPVLGALAFSHNDRALAELDVLHAQAQAFEQAHASAVKQARQQRQHRPHPGLRLQRRQHRGHLVGRQHGGQAPFRARAADLAHPRQVQTQHLLIQEQQG